MVVCVCVLQTFKNGTSITVESNRGGNIKLKSAGTSADITRKDLYACKVGVGPDPCHSSVAAARQEWKDMCARLPPAS